MRRRRSAAKGLLAFGEFSPPALRRAKIPILKGKDRTVPDSIMAILKPLGFIAAALAYVLIKRIAAKRRAAESAGDTEYLAQWAVYRGCSEYDLFHECGRTWHIPTSRVEEDFKTYLRRQSLPHYVRDGIRKARQDRKGQTLPPCDPGGKLPPSWSA
jgi:hypothetical protein